VVEQSQFNYMKLQQRRIGEESARGATGDLKYKTIEINFNDLDYGDGSMNKLKDSSPQREDAADGSIIAPDTARAHSRAASNAQ